MRRTYQALEVFGGVVTLKDDGSGDFEAVIPVRNIVSFDVDWTVGGGSIVIFTNQGVGLCNYNVKFETGDSGQACADAISDLFRELRSDRDSLAAVGE